MPRILLVDDDEVFNMLHSEILERVIPNASIESLQSGRELMTYLDQNPHEEIDLLLIDIRMPTMSGIETLEQLSQTSPTRLEQIQIYLLSSTLDPAEIRHATSIPCVTGYIDKPMMFESVPSLSRTEG
ncbi:MAG: response regulator [Akkermansiaceae bacterium]|nr:response regulator [Akkermansiaceae bacterium]